MNNTREPPKKRPRTEDSVDEHVLVRLKSSDDAMHYVARMLSLRLHPITDCSTVDGFCDQPVVVEALNTLLMRDPEEAERLLYAAAVADDDDCPAATATAATTAAASANVPAAEHSWCASVS